MVFFAAALVDAHAAVALGALRARGQPLSTLKSVVLSGEPGRCSAGWALGWESELEVYPQRSVAGLPTEIKDLCEG